MPENLGNSRGIVPFVVNFLEREHTILWYHREAFKYWLENELMQHTIPKNI